MSKFHRTAMSRKNFSTPVQHLLKKELFDDYDTILDYGCGRGGDVERLADWDYVINGYDPNGKYSNDWTVLNRTYDVIMCNFVLNVIEDDAERKAVEDEIIRLLSENGRAFISVRNDVHVKNGCTSTGTWQGFVEPVNEGWELIKTNSKFKMWKYKKVTR